ncbi:hypothetical protein ACJBV6_10650, partial [Streptococcus suis]
DPSMGRVNFFAGMHKQLRENIELYGVELDTISGAIAKHLNPNSHIEIKGIETEYLNDNNFEIVISNVQISNILIAEKRNEKPYMI